MQSGIARAERDVPEKAKELQQIELKKLDKLEAMVWEQLNKDKQKQRPVNPLLVDRVIRLSESKRKLLGLDPPSRIAGDPEGEPIHIELSQADLKI